MIALNVVPEWAYTFPQSVRVLMQVKLFCHPEGRVSCGPKDPMQPAGSIGAACECLGPSLRSGWQSLIGALVERFRLPGDVLLASGFFFGVFLHPGFPALARSGVAAGEGEAGNVNVRNRDFLARVLRVEPDN